MHFKNISVLSKKSFSDVPKESIEEGFYAESFGRVFTFTGKFMVDMLTLYKRKIVFDKVDIILGGIGGVCVSKGFQGKSIATLMLKTALEILKNKNCYIACLNVDLEKNIYSLYEKAGFQMMDREISFENIKGKKIFDKGTMFIPINSLEKNNLVINSKNTFHYGKGYW
jgi:GNAT superfamily N-acetyltransferase